MDSHALKIGERIKLVREKKQLSQKAFAEKCGNVPSTTISKYEQGLIKPSAEILSKMGYMGININWLLTGEGTMSSNTRAIQEGDHIDAFDAEPPRLACGLYGQGEFVFVPISSEKACCGKGAPIFEEYDIGESIAVKRNALGSLSESAPPYAVETQGRSMEGFGIREGSTVIVNPAERPTSGDVVLVAIDEKGAVKKYYERKEGIELVSSTSDSLRFTYEELEEGWGIRICGRVMLVIAPPEDGV